MKQIPVRITCRKSCFGPEYTDTYLPRDLVMVTILTGNCGQCNEPLSVSRRTETK